MYELLLLDMLTLDFAAVSHDLTTWTFSKTFTSAFETQKCEERSVHSFNSHPYSQLHANSI